METNNGQELAAGATTASSLTVQVSEEIANNVGELAAETAIAFAMGRATSGENPPQLEPGSGSSKRQKAPVKKQRGRPRKASKKQLPSRMKPTPEGKKLSSLAGSGESKKDLPKSPQLLSGRQISRIMGQDPMQQIQNPTAEEGLANTDPGLSRQVLETISDPSTISLTPPVKRKRGRPKKVRELVQPPPLSIPPQPPAVINLPPFSPELLTANPESVLKPSRTASESSDTIHLIKQPPFTELDGWPIAAIAVNDSAGNMQPAALIIMHSSGDSSQSTEKRPRGRPKKHPPIKQPRVDTDTDSGKSSTAARLEEVDALSQCKTEAEASVSKVTPPGESVPVKRRSLKKTPAAAPINKCPRIQQKSPTASPIIKRPRGRPKKTPTTTPVIKRPRGRPKKPRPPVAPQQALPQQPVDPQTAHGGPRTTGTSVIISLKDKEDVPISAKTAVVEEPKDDYTLLQEQATTVETVDLQATVSGESTVVPAKRKRGRPPKPKPLETPVKPKRPRGRPRKSSLLSQPLTSSSQQTKPSAMPTPIKRPRGRPPKHPRPAKLQELVTAEVTSETTTMVDSSPALPAKHPRSRSRKNPRPKQIRPHEPTVATCTHTAIIEISPPAMDPQILAPPLAGGEGDPDMTETQVPDVPLPCPSLPPVSDSEETAEVNFMDAPNIPLPFEILSKVRSVLPPEDTTNGLNNELVLQRAEPPTMACTVANGVHTVLSPVINVGRPRKRPRPQDLAESSLQASEGPSRTEEHLAAPVKRPRGRPPKKRQSLEQTPTADPSAIPVKRRPGRPRKKPLPSPSLAQAGATPETKHEDVLNKPLSAQPTCATAVNIPIKQPLHGPPSLPAATAGNPQIPQPSQPPAIPASRGPQEILPKVREIPGLVPIHGEIKVKRRPGRPRKRPLEPEPDKKGSSTSDGGLPVKKRRGRPSKKQHVQLNETDDTSSVCPPDGGTLTAQVKAVMEALPNESTTKDSSSKASSAMNVSWTSSRRDESQDSSSNFQLRLSVSFSDSSDDMDPEGDTRTALQMLADRVKSDGDPKVEESEDDSSSSYVSTFD